MFNNTPNMSSGICIEHAGQGPRAIFAWAKVLKARNSEYLNGEAERCIDVHFINASCLVHFDCGKCDPMSNLHGITKSALYVGSFHTIGFLPPLRFVFQACSVRTRPVFNLPPRVVQDFPWLS